MALPRFCRNDLDTTYLDLIAAVFLRHPPHDDQVFRKDVQAARILRPVPVLEERIVDRNASAHSSQVPERHFDPGLFLSLEDVAESWAKLFGIRSRVDVDGLDRKLVFVRDL